MTGFEPVQRGHVLRGALTMLTIRPLHRDKHLATGQGLNYPVIGYFSAGYKLLQEFIDIFR